MVPSLGAPHKMATREIVLRLNEAGYQRLPSRAVDKHRRRPLVMNSMVCTAGAWLVLWGPNMPAKSSGSDHLSIMNIKHECGHGTSERGGAASAEH